MGTRVKLAVAGLLVVVILGGIGLGSYIYLRARAVEELRNGLVSTCEHSGNPLREAVQGMLEDQIAQSQNKALLHRFFPQIPPAELDRLIEEENEKRRERIEQIEPVDCAARY